MRSLWSDRRLAGRDQRHQRGKAAPPLRRDDAELGQLAADAVHLLGVLFDEQRGGPLDRLRRLLLDTPDRYKPHVRAAQRHADRRGVVLIALVVPHEGLDIGRRDEPYLRSNLVPRILPHNDMAAAPDERRSHRRLSGTKGGGRRPFRVDARGSAGAADPASVPPPAIRKRHGCVRERGLAQPCLSC